MLKSIQQNRTSKRLPGGQRIAPSTYFHLLKKYFQKITAPGTPSRPVVHGHGRAFLRWRPYGEIRLQLTRLPEQRKKTARPVLPLVPPVTRLRPHTFPATRLARPGMAPKPPMPLECLVNASGNISDFPDMYGLLSCNFQKNGPPWRAYCDILPVGTHNHKTEVFLLPLLFL